MLSDMPNIKFTSDSKIIPKYVFCYDQYADDLEDTTPIEYEIVEVTAYGREF